LIVQAYSGVASDGVWISLDRTEQMLLKDKVIFLTGGSTGIGWECAKAYAAEVA
jgi:hypothetical protein